MITQYIPCEKGKKKPLARLGQYPQHFVIDHAAAMDLIASGGAVHAVLPPSIIVIDLDVKKPGQQGLKQMDALLRSRCKMTLDTLATLTPTVKTQSGGRHVWLRCPDGHTHAELRGYARAEGLEDVELLVRWAMFPGSHIDTENGTKKYKWMPGSEDQYLLGEIMECPEVLWAFLIGRTNQTPRSHVSQSRLQGVWSVDHLQRALPIINPNLLGNYETWRDTIFALHHVCDGDADCKHEVSMWAGSADGYNDGQGYTATGKLWDACSCDREDGGVLTVLSLRAWARQTGLPAIPFSDAEMLAMGQIKYDQADAALKALQTLYDATQIEEATNTLTPDEAAEMRGVLARHEDDTKHSEDSKTHVTAKEIVKRLRKFYKLGKREADDVRRHDPGIAATKKEAIALAGGRVMEALYFVDADPVDGAVRRQPTVYQVGGNKWIHYDHANKVWLSSIDSNLSRCRLNHILKPECQQATLDTGYPASIDEFCNRVWEQHTRQQLPPFPAKFFERPPMAFADGTVALIDALGSASIRDTVPNDAVMRRVEYAYDGQVKCPQFEKFLLGMLGSKEAVDTLHLLLGSLLLPRRKWEKFILLYGTGGDGKTTLCSIIKRVLGAGTVVPMSIANCTSQFGLSQLEGARLMFDDEAVRSNERQMVLSTDVVKKMCSGEEIEIERKYENKRSVKNNAMVMLAFNSWPKLYDVTESVRRRAVVFRMRKKFTGTGSRANFVEELAPEYPGIFNWLLRGAQRCAAYDGDFPLCQENIEAWDAWCMAGNTFLGWFAAHFKKSDGKTVQITDEIYQSYRQFSSQMRGEKLALVELYRRFQDVDSKNFDDIKKRLTGYEFFVLEQGWNK